MSAGKRRQLALRISNAGGRTLFGQITSNRAWLTVNRHSFISSSTLVLVSVDTTHLQAGNDYWGNLVVSTLNGGDRVVRVSVGVAEPVQPVIAGIPATIDFGTAAPGPGQDTDHSAAQRRLRAASTAASPSRDAGSRPVTAASTAMMPRSS